MTIKLSDIAKKAKVSATTVSMILNRKEGFSYSQETIDRVLKTVDELGYQPNLAAKLMRNKKTRLLGVAVQPDSSFHAYETINLCCEWISKLEYEPIMINLLDPQKSHNTGPFNQVNFLQGIICIYPNQEEKAIALCKKHKINLPIISLFKKNTAHKNIREVYSNHYVAFEEGIKYLCSLNHSKIAYAGTEFNPEYPNFKLDGFVAAAEKYKIKHAIFTEMVTNKECMYEIGEAIAEKIIKNGKSEFSAILCGNDEIAVSLMSTLMRSGIKVPEDISIIGYDDIPLASHCCPRLTTFRQKRDEIASCAAKLLIACIDGNDNQNNFFPQSIGFDPELIIRDSVRKLEP